MRTQVGIIGAGPAGLLLSPLLHLNGIESVVIEERSEDYVRQRVRAGVLENTTTDLLREVGLGERMDREGLVHGGVSFRFDGADHRIAFEELVGRNVTVYGQQEVVKDLIDARNRDGGQLLFEVSGTAVHDIDTDRPRITFTDSAGQPQELVCDVIAGCDGFHGVSRKSVPHQAYDHTYPFAWLGILAKAAPTREELAYTHHERGFALYSMRSPEITRLYLQVAPDEDIADWPDDRIWAELHTRMAVAGESPVLEGPLLDKGITAMRSFVATPMRHGRLFLAGDAAHIVPPTGAKGLNLAASDVHYLSQAFREYYDEKSSAGIDGYSGRALARVWKAVRFSWWMTSMLHKFPDEGDFGARIQLAELDYVVNSKAASASLSENYVGLPF